MILKEFFFFNISRRVVCLVLLFPVFCLDVCVLMLLSNLFNFFERKREAGSGGGFHRFLQAVAHPFPHTTQLSKFFLL